MLTLILTNFNIWKLSYVTICKTTNIHPISDVATDASTHSGGMINVRLGYLNIFRLNGFNFDHTQSAKRGRYILIAQFAVWFVCMAGERPRV